MSVELPFLDLFNEVSSENSVNYAQRGLLVCGQQGLELSIVLLNNRLLYSWSRCRCLRCFGYDSFRFVVVGRLVIASTIFVNHEEGSEKIELIVLSDVVVELFELDNDSGIVLDT